MDDWRNYPFERCPVCGWTLFYCAGRIALYEGDPRYGKYYYVLRYDCDHCLYGREFVSMPAIDPFYSEHQALVSAYEKEQPPFLGKR